MNSSRLQWHFPELQYADSEGVNDPLLQYFEGDHNRSIAREVIQNSIDAQKDENKPVVVRFEHKIVSADEVPGIPELRKHLEACLKQAKEEENDKAQKVLEEAVRAASDQRLSILRASDFNTTGLNGKDRDKRGQWHRLTSAVGENQMAGPGGGSYGLGKGAPYVASRLRAVYYSTWNESGEVIFQGKARLLSHELNGTEYRGVGSFGVNGFQSARSAKQIPPMFLRTEQGTDINIIGYNKMFGWEDRLISSVLDYFWMAIYSGTLEVEVAEGVKETRITSETLVDLMKKYKCGEALMFYRSETEPSQVFEKKLPLLGTCRLSVRIEDKFSKQIAMMRSPLMVVQQKRFPKTLRVPHAGVFVCNNQRGNKVLRGLEPPQHDKWDSNLDSENGKKAMRELENWVKESLQTLSDEESGDPEEIPDLERFLPYDEDSAKEANSKAGKTQSGDVSEDESALEVGAEREERQDAVEDFVRKASKNKDVAGTGKNPRKREGGGKKRPGGGTGTGDEEGDDGIKRIDTSEVQFRVMHTGQSKDGYSEYCLVLKPRSDQKGALSIVARGEDATVYPVGVSYAEEWEQKGKKYECNGPLIKGLSLKKGKALRIRVGTKSTARYALGIENHES